LCHHISEGIRTNSHSNAEHHRDDRHCDANPNTDADRINANARGAFCRSVFRYRYS